MRLKLSYGRDEIFSQFPGRGPVRLRQVLQAIKECRPDLYAGWCDRDGRLRDSLPVFVNGENIRYKNGMETELGDGDEIYIIPLIAGG